jgi:hypothetical protein
MGEVSLGALTGDAREMSLGVSMGDVCEVSLGVSMGQMSIGECTDNELIA